MLQNVMLHRLLPCLGGLSLTSLLPCPCPGPLSGLFRFELAQAYGKLGFSMSFSCLMPFPVVLLFWGWSDTLEMEHRY